MAEKLAIAVLLISWILLVTSLTQTVTKSPKEVETWFQKLSHAKPKLTKLHFYFHDLLQAKNPTAARVAQANITNTSPTFFGLVNMYDDPLTVGPELGSDMVGRAHGFYASASLEEVGLLHAMNLVFTKGKYRGSSLAVLGHNPTADLYREMPIVGGTGAFRLARGVLTLRTYFFNATAGNATIEMFVVAMHY